MIPVFGTAAILTAPTAPLLSSGYVPGNTLAAQNMNWYLYHLTKEVNNVLTSAGVSQSTLDDTQLLQSVATSGFLGSPVSGYTPAVADVVEVMDDGTIRKALK